MVEEFDAAADKFFDDHLRGRPGLDRLMYTASAAGDHGAIWAAMAGAQGLLRDAGWRPALRAATALAAESVLVNGLVKLAFRRQRPVPLEPHPLPLRTPLTSSFPSGHASSAFFAAALLRGRRTWPLCYALALTVASSRVYVRIHHASDVVGGALVGAALGEVARRVYPVWERRGFPPRRARPS
ncbi:MAG TPA: phosphatase PAP2 family protein [Acidimicrobiales bacterium]|nr:phosphatase PAP2 family protein [Acidimicrobiales bacterium]